MTLIGVSCRQDGVYVLERGSLPPYASDVATIGDRIRAARIDAGYATQEALADAAGVKTSTVSDIENDRPKSIGVVRLLKLAALIKVPIEALVFGVDGNYDRMCRDLFRHTPAEESTLPGKEGVDGPTSTRLQQQPAFVRLVLEGLKEKIRIACEDAEQALVRGEVQDAAGADATNSKPSGKRSRRTAAEKKLA